MRSRQPAEGPPRLLKFVTMPGPFVSEWAELPREVFRSPEAAHEAALAFVGSYDAGGYSVEDDSYWAREHLARDRFRFTRFVIE